MLKVYTAENPTEAHIVKGILESGGIESVVKDIMLFSARGELPITPETAPTVWVIEESRYNEAQRIVRRYEQRNADKLLPKETWLCPACGEKLEGQFTHCWQCGTPRHFPAIRDELP
tara:strand:- start:85 stop:435 length:351 start_codon:yes stop_codon:yes gene_type:complete